MSAEELKTQNALLKEQNRILEEIADALEDRVRQEALKHNLYLETDQETGRERQM